MHVDMVSSRGDAYNPTSVTLMLNKFFQKKSIPIRLLNTYLVPNNFHCRKNAISRTYMYRLVIIKGDLLHVAPVRHHIPIEEYDRALFIW